MYLCYEKSDDGCLHLLRQGETVFSIPADGSLSILYDEGKEDMMSTILKHGPSSSVDAHHRATWAAFMRASVGSKDIEGSRTLADMAADLRVVRMEVSDMTPESITEVNDCLATSGRVRGIEDRLRVMGALPAVAPCAF